MNSPKMEDQLNLAMDVTPEELAKSKGLGTGFDPVEDTWEVIVKYQGTLDDVRELGVQVEELIAGYAILNIPARLVEQVAALYQIEYMEKPKRLYFELVQALAVSCILPVTLRTPFLTGKGVLVAVLDTGIDYHSTAFRNPDGTTRILGLWDQSIMPTAENGYTPPDGFYEGSVFYEEQINRALADERDWYRLVPSVDISGHGTAVAAIAAGNSDALEYTGVSPECSLLIVKLGSSGSFPKTTQLMRGVTWCLQMARRLRMPLCINLSFGNTYGSHDGTSLLERFLDNAAEIGRTSICVGNGNEGSSAGHVGRIATYARPQREILSVGAYEQSLSLQIWLNSVDEYRIVIRSPNGESYLIETDGAVGSTITAHLEKTTLLTYIGTPSPYSMDQEIFIEMIPADNNPYINGGDWVIEITGVTLRSGEYRLYLPAQEARGEQTFFLQPTVGQTLTIPSTSSKVISVAAYDHLNESYADFSGRGFYYVNQETQLSDYGAVKPDLAAPGVGIRTFGPEDQQIVVSGTSFATPFVTGSCALMMEQGIIRGYDPYCYGEKMKAYLRAGARPIRGESTYPNERIGWGALCLRDSLPG